MLSRFHEFQTYYRAGSLIENSFAFPTPKASFCRWDHKCHCSSSLVDDIKIMLPDVCVVWSVFPPFSKEYWLCFIVYKPQRQMLCFEIYNGNGFYVSLRFYIEKITFVLYSFVILIIFILYLKMC